MGLVGLWHGAGWGFLIWGLLHGAYLVIYRIYESVKSAHADSGESPLIAGIWRVITLVGVTVAWVPFRAATLGKAGAILASMFCRFAGGRAYGRGFYAFALIVMLFCVIEPSLMRKLSELDERSGTEGLSPFRVIVRPVAYLVGLLLFLLFDEHNTQFIYSQF